MPDWATILSLQIFVVSLAFSCGVLFTRVNFNARAIDKLEKLFEKKFDELHRDFESLRKAIGTRRTNG